MIFETCANIKKLSGNAKLEYIKESLESNDELKTLLDFLMNSTIITNIAKKKLKKSINDDIEYKKIKNFKEFIEFLTNECDGKDTSIKTIQKFATTYQNESFIFDIASKSLKLGLQITSYNKILNNLKLPEIPQFNVQLAITIEKITKKLDKNANWLGDFYITEKLDGVRCIAIYKQNKWQFHTRNGNEIENLEFISDELLKYNVPKNRILDGELLIKNESQKAEDSFRATVSELSPKNKDKKVVYHIFDSVLYSEFQQDSCSESYTTRRNIINNFRVKQNAKIVPVLYHGSDMKETMKLFNKMVERGAEGLMLNKDAIYQCKRTDNLLKIKQFNENDGLIKDVYEGSGNNINKLGGILITYKNNIIKIGSGFTDKERIDYWNHPEKIINKIGTYQFTSESKNQKNNTLDVRFGRWKGLRLDKIEESYDN